MDAFTRYSRKIRMTLIKAVTLICFICLIYIPKETTTQNTEAGGYFTVTLNDQVLGAVNSAEEADEALIVARGRISAEAGEIVYMNPDLSVSQEKQSFGKRLSVDEMADAMYDVLKDSRMVFNKQDAYTIRINDYTVTLGTKDEIAQLIEAVKEKYDVNNEFQVRITGNADAAVSDFGVEIVKVDVGSSGASKVVNTVNGEVVIQADADTIFEDGTLAMVFSEPISVTPTSVNASQISNVQTAFEEITKETEEKTIYVVQAGDTLSKIASEFNLTISQLCDLNEGLSADGIIGINDRIVVTVPTPELSVKVFEEMTYEESYNAEVQYIDDDTMYQNQSVVVQAGSEGYREVVAVVQYENNAEVSRDIIKEVLLVESVPRIVRRGTLTPPTYIKPIAGGYLTSHFGARWGRNHNGVDWGVPTGTSVRASSAGVVIRSGWFSTYGICVDIQHPNGTMTRYAHLSRTLVSVGQTVTQNQEIARSGNTGDSTGPHLHFEIRVGGTPVNPLPYLE
ncbi:MAG: peptidoglycan DD-metalloendopeptidase family protein [Alistipes sp.]|nr:peptidoglycan DD-metalloendopeptidase family protein [Alistipes sp.]